jgi:rhodanese-related sulfurtransferase
MKQFLTCILSFICFVSYAQLSQKTVEIENRLNNMESFHISVDATQTSRIMDEQGSRLVLIDVRTPEEVANGKIKDALEVDIKSPDFSEKVAQLDKTKQYMVYDYAGGRSKRAMEIMKELGFKQVYDLKDGYKAWKELHASKK